MKRIGFTNQQIAYALRQAEVGTPVEPITCRVEVGEATIYRWKKILLYLIFTALGEQQTLAEIVPHEIRQFSNFPERLSFEFFGRWYG